MTATEDDDRLKAAMTELHARDAWSRPDFRTALQAARAQKASVLSQPATIAMWVATAGLTAALVIAGVNRLRRSPSPVAPSDGTPISVSDDQRARTPAEKKPRRRQPTVAGIPADPGVTEAMLSFDFEDGLLPAIFNRGEIVTGVCPEGSRYCAIGTLTLPWMINFGVSFEVDPSLHLKFADNLKVSFDYRLGDDAPDVSVQFWDLNKKKNYYVTVDRPVHERWAHAEMSLANPTPVKGRDPSPIEEGDAIDNFVIVGGRVGGKPFYVDNIKVFFAPAP